MYIECQGAPACNRSYDCQAEAHYRDCRVKQRYIDEAFKKARESANTDHETLEEFVRKLATATVYDSRDTGEVIVVYWKQEAEEWVKKLDNPPLPDPCYCNSDEECNCGS